MAALARAAAGAAGGTRRVGKQHRTLDGPAFLEPSAERLRAPTPACCDRGARAPRCRARGARELAPERTAGLRADSGTSALRGSRTPLLPASTRAVRRGVRSCERGDRRPPRAPRLGG